MPLTNDYGKLHIDQYLTNFSLQYPQGNFIFKNLDCIVPVQKKSDKIRFRGTNNFNIYNALRKNKAPANLIDRSEGIPISYFCEERALKDIVLQEDIDLADEPIRIEEEAVEDLTFNLNLLLEKEISDLLRNTSNIQNSSLSGTSQWSDYDNSTPYKDLKELKEKGWKNVKVKFNKIIIPYSVAITLSHHPDTKDLLKYTMPGEKLIIQDITLPAQILGMQVIIADTSFNNANPGQNKNLEEVWGKDIICLYQSAPTRNSYSCFKVFQFKDLNVRTGENFDPEGKIILVSRYYDVKLIDGNAGYLLQNVIS